MRSSVSRAHPAVLLERAPAVLLERAPAVLPERAPAVLLERAPAVLTEHAQWMAVLSKLCSASVYQLCSVSVHNSVISYTCDMMLPTPTRTLPHIRVPVHRTSLTGSTAHTPTHTCASSQNISYRQYGAHSHTHVCQFTEHLLPAVRLARNKVPAISIQQ